MNETDAFFTQTVVGPPFSISLGRPLTTELARAQGLTVDLETGQSRVTAAWHDWLVLSHAMDAPGWPRRIPGALRRRLERHALWLAVFGLVNFVGAVILVAMRQ